MYAADNVDDALEATKRYVSALGALGWLKLGVVVLFIGGIGIANQGLNVFGEIGPEAIEDPADLTPVLAAGAVVLAIYAAFRYLAAVLEFVFVESLRSESLSVRRDARANLGRGLWLLLFRALLWLGLFLAVAAPVAAVFVLGDVGDPGDLSAAQIATIALIGLVVVAGWRAAYTLTTAFVVPIMLAADRGPVGAWRRFASVIAANWVGVLAALLLTWTIWFVLWVTLAIVGFFVMFFGLLLVVLLAAVFEALHPSLDVVALALLLGGYLFYQYVVALVEAPLRAYIRYFALLLLGDTDPSLDLVAEQRGAIRSAGSATDDALERRDGRPPRPPRDEPDELHDRFDRDLEGSIWDEPTDREEVSSDDELDDDERRSR